jgi:cephalosporin-C deacetylase-like acetyl esterase
MTEESQDIKESFLYPIANYHGKFTPQKLVFNANLQLFAQQVSYLCNLEANGKMTSEDTYDEIKKFWKQLKQSKEELLDNTKFNPEE